MSDREAVAAGWGEGADGIVPAALARAPLPDDGELARLAGALGPFCVVDLETTGLDPARSRVVEIGAVLVGRDGAPEVFHRFVDPGVALPAFVRRLTGLADADLVGAPSWDQASRELARRATGMAIVAHNAAFERAYLAPLLPATTAFLDTLELACILRPELPTHRLDALSRGLFGRAERHRALDDALDTLGLLAALAGEVAAGEHALLCGAFAGRPGLAWSGWLAQLAPRGGGDLVLRGERAVGAAAPTGPDARSAAGRAAIPAQWLEPGFVRELLADEQRWQRVVPGYRMREGQVDLALAILDAFRSERAFAAEAGTGIGKTLAYGLVAVLHALRGGERVVVSSANRTLQERIVIEEVPRISAVLGVAPPPALVLKGRSNYASAHRVRTILAEDEALGLGLAPPARAWLTSFLDRCTRRELQGAFGGWLGAQDRVLQRVGERIACDLDCDEERCRADADGPCAYLARVGELREAGIVSVNHALLLAWPSRYGAIERLVIDEAHELAAEADRSFSEEIAARDLRGLLRRLGAAGGRAGMIPALVAGEAEPAAGRELADLAAECLEAVEEVGAALAPLTPSGEVGVPAAGDPRGAWGGVEAGLARLSRLAVALGDALERQLLRYRRRRGGDADDALAGEAAIVATALANQGRGLLADVFEQSRPETVYAARAFRRADGHDWSLRATPLEIAPLLHARLLEPARTVVAVSATLGLGGDPAPSLRKMGWDEIERVRRRSSLVVPSPFDFRRRAVLAIVRGDGWRDRAFVDRCADAICDVARLLGGRTLGLFTSRQRLLDTAARVSARLAEEGLPVLAHDRPGGAARLVEQFAADPRAVLLGTRSLWQGVDVPGEALSCVVIDKLPFPRPDEPLLRGRSARVAASGGDAFRELSLEPAVIGFKQMFGRLIRSEEDRGFVVLLGADPSKGYVEEFIASLPGPPRVLVAPWPEVVAEMRGFFGAPADGRAG